MVGKIGGYMGARIKLLERDITANQLIFDTLNIKL